MNMTNTIIASNLLHVLPSTNQKGRVLNHLLNVGSLSQLEADELYRVKRLTSRITELKQHGVGIKVERKHDHTGKLYVRYTLGE